MSENLPQNLPSDKTFRTKNLPALSSALQMAKFGGQSVGIFRRWLYALTEEVLACHYYGSKFEHEELFIFVWEFLSVHGGAR